MGFVEEQKEIEKKVERLLEDHQLSRENDTWLTILYWNRVNGINFYIPYSDINKLTPPESITRARRKIQAEGKLLPENPEVLIKRKVRANLVRNYLAGSPKLDKWEKLYEKMSGGIKRVNYPKEGL